MARTIGICAKIWDQPELDKLLNKKFYTKETIHIMKAALSAVIFLSFNVYTYLSVKYSKQPCRPA